MEARVQAERTRVEATRQQAQNEMLVALQQELNTLKQNMTKPTPAVVTEAPIPSAVTAPSGPPAPSVSGSSPLFGRQLPTHLSPPKRKTEPLPAPIPRVSEEGEASASVELDEEALRKMLASDNELSDDELGDLLGSQSMTLRSSVSSNVLEGSVLDLQLSLTNLQAMPTSS